MTSIVLADTVDIRHACHCATATEPPAPGEPDEHVFTVDGVSFPWHITTRGPRVTELQPNLFAIKVDILLIGLEADGPPPFSYDVFHQAVTPVIGGVKFPWAMTTDGWILRCGAHQCPTLTLSFLTRHVTGNPTIRKVS